LLVVPKGGLKNDRERHVSPWNVVMNSHGRELKKTSALFAEKPGAFRATEGGDLLPEKRVDRDEFILIGGDVKSLVRREKKAFEKKKKKLSLSRGKRVRENRGKGRLSGKGGSSGGGWLAKWRDEAWRWT